MKNTKHVRQAVLLFTPPPTPLYIYFAVLVDEKKKAVGKADSIHTSVQSVYSNDDR